MATKKSSLKLSLNGTNSFLICVYQNDDLISFSIWCFFFLEFLDFLTQLDRIFKRNVWKDVRILFGSTTFIAKGLFLQSGGEALKMWSVDEG